MEIWCFNCKRLMVEHKYAVYVCINCEARIHIKQSDNEIIKSCDDGGCSVI